jgi:hypothetical protein
MEVFERRLPVRMRRKRTTVIPFEQLIAVKVVGPEPIDYEQMEGWVIDSMNGRQRIEARIKGIKHSYSNRDRQLTPREQMTNDELLLNAVNAAADFVAKSDFNSFTKFVDLLDKLDREAI